MKEVRYVVMTSHVYGAGHWTNWEDCSRPNKMEHIARRQYEAVVAASDQHYTQVRLVRRVTEEFTLEKM